MWIFYILMTYLLTEIGGKVMDDTNLLVQIQAGRSAVLPCTVYELNNGMVIWQDPRDVLLFLNDTKQATTDSRMTLSNPFKNDWNLHINNVKYNDRGSYTCSVTGSTSKKIVTLEVQVSSVISDESSSSDTRVVEGGNVTLECDATGIPTPSVTWQFTNYDGLVEPNIWEGSSFSITNITRQQAGIYKCIAFNTVGLPDTKDIKVQVEYPPVVEITQERIKQSLGKGTMLECKVSTFPQGQIYWTKDSIIYQSNWQYKVSLYSENEISYVISMEIPYIQTYDFGTYKCVAMNNHSIAEGIVVLEENKPPTTTTTTKTTTPPSTTSSSTTPYLSTTEYSTTNTETSTILDTLTSTFPTSTDYHSSKTSHETSSPGKQTVNPIVTPGPLEPGYDTINETKYNSAGLCHSCRTTILFSVLFTMLLLDYKRSLSFLTAFVISVTNVP